jgi:hypothetical protein
MIHCTSENIDMKELENDLFEIKVKHETIVSPLREYILEWLKEALIKFTEPKNQETTQGVMLTHPQPTSTKGTPQRNQSLR